LILGIIPHLLFFFFYGRDDFGPTWAGGHIGFPQKKKNYNFFIVRVML
jgi:hypothetical protein